MISQIGSEGLDFGVRGHVRAFALRDMSRSSKAATCRRSPNRHAPDITLEPVSLPLQHDRPTTIGPQKRACAGPVVL